MDFFCKNEYEILRILTVLFVFHCDGININETFIEEPMFFNKCFIYMFIMFNFFLSHSPLSLSRSGPEGKSCDKYWMEQSACRKGVLSVM